MGYDCDVMTEEPAGIAKRRRTISGKAVILTLIVVWVAITVFVVWVVVQFKRGGVDALRVDKQAQPAQSAPAPQP